MRQILTKKAETSFLSSFKSQSSQYRSRVYPATSLTLNNNNVMHSFTIWVTRLVDNE